MHSAHRLRRLQALLAVGIALTATACSGGSESVDRRFEPDHVHGLVADEDAGRLLIATHDGLFSLDESGDPVAVNDQSTDLMGFTVGASGDFYASGHPGAGEDGPPLLGLVTSSDGGSSFTPISLSGQADFHALESTETSIYGVDGGTTLMRSGDAGATWESSALPLPVADIAVDPTSDALLVTTERGLLRSDDAGRTFTPLDGAPVLQFIDWGDDGTLVGVDPSGQMYVAADPGSWTAAAALDPAQAITVTGEGVVYVATTGELLRSDDQAATFTTVTTW